MSGNLVNTSSNFNRNYNPSLGDVDFLTKKIQKLEERMNYLERENSAIVTVTSEWNDSIEKKINSLYSRIDEEKQLLKQNVDILSEIGQFQDNWNSYGAKKFSQELIFKCLRIINAMNLKFQPEIYPTARYSIQLEYEPDESHYLEIEVFEDKIKLYKRVFDETLKSDNLSIDETIKHINEFQTQFG